MKPIFTILCLFFWGLAMILTPASLKAQMKDKGNYGKTPDALFPFANFQEPYKRHFVYPPQPYLGPNREKPEPTGSRGGEDRFPGTFGRFTARGLWDPDGKWRTARHRRGQCQRRL
jgi:hypothetical protein